MVVVSELKVEGKGGWTGYIDGYLKQNLDHAKNVIKKNWDFLFIVDGMEGAGKSVIAQQIAKYLDPTFDESRLCFTGEKVKIEVRKPSNRYKAVIFDEAYSSMSSRGAMSKINQTMVDTLTKIRQNNIFLIMVLPSFFELDRYPACHRSRALIHVYTKNFERGRFAFYGYDRKRILYHWGKKNYYSYRYPKPNFIGSFTDGYVIERAMYDKLKLDDLNNTQTDLNRNEGIVKESRFTVQYRTAVKSSIIYFKKKHRYSITELATIFGLSRKTISEIFNDKEIDELKEEDKKLGKDVTFLGPEVSQDSQKQVDNPNSEPSESVPVVSKASMVMEGAKNAKATSGL